jgi:hypothetical protein
MLMKKCLTGSVGTFPDAGWMLLLLLLLLAGARSLIESFSSAAIREKGWLLV